MLRGTAARAACGNFPRGWRVSRCLYSARRVAVRSISDHSNGDNTTASGPYAARSPAASSGRSNVPGGRGRGRTSGRPPGGPHGEGGRTWSGRGGSRKRSPDGRGSTDVLPDIPDDSSPVRSGSAGSRGRGRTGKDAPAEQTGRSGRYGLGDAGRGRSRGRSPLPGDRSPSSGRGASWGDRADRGQGRTGAPPGSPPGNPDDLRQVRDLPSLAALVERHVGTWAEAKHTRTLRAAFSKLGALGTAPGPDPATASAAELTRRTMELLAAAYLPLVPGLPDAFSCAAPLWTCAKLGFWEGGLAEGLLARLGEEQLMQGANGQDHANLWWAVSEAPGGLRDLAAAALLASGRCLVGMKADQLTEQGWSNVLLACGRLQWGAWLKWRDELVLLHHVTACLAAKPGIKDQHLANAIYSLGELAEDCGQEPRPEDLQLLAEQVVVRLQQRQGFKPQGLSNMLLGCAKLQYQYPALLLSLAAAAAQAAPCMDTQHLANSLYALAKLSCTDAAYTPAVQLLLSEVRGRLQQAPDSFVPQSLSNMLWALEALRPPGLEEYAAVLAAECRRRRFAGFKPQNISNSVWALAKLRCTHDQDWYEAAVEAAMQPGAMDGAHAQSWTNLLYGLALMEHRPPKGLLRAMSAADILDAFRTSATPQHCANLLWSLARLNLYEQRLVDVLGERLGELLRRDPAQLAEQVLANSLWALATMSECDVLRRHSGLVEGLLREVVRRWEAAQGGEPSGSVSPNKEEELTQLWQVQLELGLVDGSGSMGLRGILQEARGAAGGSLLAAAEGARLESNRDTSRTERQVAGALEQLQGRLAEGQGCSSAIRSIRREYPAEGVCGRVDVVVEMADGRRVAVEVDGPSHFFANQPHTKNGPTQLRDRQLERVFGPGNVVSVPYWEWDSLESDSDREEYLSRLLGLKWP